MAPKEKFDVYIEVDEKRVQEYDDEELDTVSAESQFPNVAKYIEAQSGQQFQICLRIQQGYVFPPAANSLLWDVSVDGKLMKSMITSQERYISIGSWLHVVDNMDFQECDSWFSKPFLFKDLDITQDNIPSDSESMKQKMKSLGTIDVEVWSYCTLGYMAPEQYGEHDVQFQTSVSEKALKGKAVTLGIGLGEKRKSKAPIFREGYTIDTQPIAKFIFHYRNKKSLQELMVIPRDDEIIDDQVEHMTAQELRHLLRRKMANSADTKIELKPRVKREMKADHLDEDILEIREVKRHKTSSIEIIEIDSD